MKEIKRLKARELRKQGLSMNKIASELSVSKSSVSLWVRDIILTEKQKQCLKDNIPKIGSRKRGFRKKGDISKRRKMMGEKKWAKYQKERINKKVRQWRINNPEKYVNRDNDLKIKLVMENGGKCIKCGYNKCIGCLEFHHRDPEEKEFTIGRNHRSYKNMKKEADKCDLLCSNCHREFHWEEGQLKRDIRIEKLRHAVENI